MSIMHSAFPTCIKEEDTVHHNTHGATKPNILSSIFGKTSKALFTNNRRKLRVSLEPVHRTNGPPSPGRGAEGDEQVTASRRPQSPVTQAVESQFRKMMQGITSSIDAAAASLELSLREAQQHLARDLGDSEGDVVKQIQVKYTFGDSDHM